MKKIKLIDLMYRIFTNKGDITAITKKFIYNEVEYKYDKKLNDYINKKGKNIFSAILKDNEITMKNLNLAKCFELCANTILFIEE